LNKGTTVDNIIPFRVHSRDKWEKFISDS